MKPIIFAKIFSLICMIYMGSSDEIQPLIPPGSTLVKPLPSMLGIALNPTEVKLKGDWYLRLMSTADTIFFDSIYSRSNYIRFTDMAYPGNNRPAFRDKANLAVKAKPNDLYLVNDDLTYNALDSGRLRIIFNYFLMPTPDTSYYNITRLSNDVLVLTHSIQGEQWTFYR